ncbi:uncharacterized protein MYCFIDRAFT_173779, partial [Pseudocercospora fijiensis CIRAD86]
GITQDNPEVKHGFCDAPRERRGNILISRYSVSDGVSSRFMTGQPCAVAQLSIPKPCNAIIVLFAAPGRVLCIERFIYHMLLPKL